jgi:PAS domain-containing protein
LIVLAIPAVADARGPFASASVPAAAVLANILTLRLFVLVIGAPLIFLAALVQESAQANAALRESQERYRRVVGNLPRSAVLLFDDELRHRFAGGPELLTLGLRPQMVEGRSLWEALPDNLAAELAPMYQAVRSGQAVVADVP